MYKKELSVIAFVILFLLPVASQAFTAERSLVPGESYAVYRAADAGWRIEGTFVTTNDIEFFICDESNYTAWRLHDTFVRYNYTESSLGEQINFTVPYGAVWYVVFSNIQDRGVDGLDIEVNYIDLSNVTQTQVDWISHSPEIDYLLIGFVGALAVIGLFGVLVVLRRAIRNR
ncbi:MAG: hypothetical protein ACFFEK_12425 [Candidatus Thorarchaeota archaeon]